MDRPADAKDNVGLDLAANSYFPSGVRDCVVGIQLEVERRAGPCVVKTSASPGEREVDRNQVLTRIRNNVAG